MEIFILVSSHLYVEAAPGFVVNVVAIISGIKNTIVGCKLNCKQQSPSFTSEYADRISHEMSSITKLAMQ